MLSYVITMMKLEAFMNIRKPKTRHPLRENLRLARQLLGGTLPTRVAKSLELSMDEIGGGGIRGVPSLSIAPLN